MQIIRWKTNASGNFDTTAGWAGDTGPSTVPDVNPFDDGAGFGNAASAGGVAMTKSPKLTTLVSFTNADGGDQTASLSTDAAGDLFGTTYYGGADADGTVFEISKTERGYAGAPTTLLSFKGTDGANPACSLIADAAGDLFGTTYNGGADNDGTVFEISKTRGGYAGKPTILVSFSGADGAMPYDGLIADAAGDLFGTTELGGGGDGTVFEIAKIKGGYAKAPTTLVSFVDGEFPTGSLVADAAGDLFGTTPDGGDDGDGEVFEVVKTGNGYSDKPITLVSFTGADGEYPAGTLIIDAMDDLFGATPDGGPDGGGTVFEIAKTKAGYAGKPTTLVSFAGADGSYPNGDLIADAAGDLFGTTQFGGADNDGTVFEIAKTKGGYAAAPATLVSLTGTNGELPLGGLIADAAGSLFGTTSYGGVNGAGTVFEITHSGFVPPAAPTTPDNAGIAPSSPPSAAFVQAMASHGAGRLGATGATNLDPRNESPTFLSRPQAS